MENVLNKIKDEDVRLAVTKLIEEKEAQALELETARKTAKALQQRVEKLEVVNTDLYARVVAGTVDTKQEDVKPKTLDEIADDIAKKLKTK
jgi:Zn-dependent oligopeptidase